MTPGNKYFFTCPRGQLVSIGNDESNGVGVGTVAVDADVFNERTSLQFRFNFAERNVLAELQLDQVLLAINDFQGTCKEEKSEI